LAVPICLRCGAGRPDDDVIPATHHAEAVNEAVERIQHVIGHQQAPLSPLRRLFATGMVKQR
jgi:hypothetical protein